MELPKFYRMRDLRLAFSRAGLFLGDNPIYFTTKIRRLEKSGRLKLPRNGSGHRQFTLEQIAEIVAAFLPGGPGVYYYKKPKMTKVEMQAIQDAVVQERITKKISELEGKDADINRGDKSKVSESERQQQVSKRVSALRKENRVRVHAHANNRSEDRAGQD